MKKKPSFLQADGVSPATFSGEAHFGFVREVTAKEERVSAEVGVEVEDVWVTRGHSRGTCCVSVSRLLKHGIQSSAVVLQDPVGHAPQERVWVRYDLFVLS